MARTHLAGRTWRDLPASPPVGDAPAGEPSPPPIPPDAPPPPPSRGRGWLAAFALALLAALAVVAVWIFADDDDRSSIIGQPQPGAAAPVEPGQALDDLLEQFGDVDDLPDAFDEALDLFREGLPDDLDELPDDLEQLIPPGFLDGLQRFFEDGELPDGSTFDPFQDLPPDLFEDFQQFFDEFGRAIPQFDLDDFTDPDGYFAPRDFFFQFGNDVSVGLRDLPDGYRVAGSSSSTTVVGGEARISLELSLEGPQGPVTIRAETRRDAADALTGRPGDPYDVRGRDGKLANTDDMWLLSFAEGDLLVSIEAENRLPEEDLVSIAEALEIQR